MEKHTKIVGALHVGFGGTGVLAALIVFIVMAISGVLGAVSSGEARVVTVTFAVGGVIAFIIALVSVPQLLGGVGLLMGKSWARTLTLIVGAVNLLNIPFGTALGIYTIWALTKTDGSEPATVRLTTASS